MSNALKNQSNNMMNHSFKNGTSYKSVIINDENIDARFFSNTNYSIMSDAVDYKLQFRPHVKYPLGTYVSIPNEENEYEDWIIVYRSDDTMFAKYNILKCNYTLRWVSDYKLVEYQVVLRDKKGVGTGLWSNEYMVILDNQISLWLPSNIDVDRLSHGDRFIITHNETNPVSYKITKADDVLIKGVTRFTLTQDELSVYDNIELKVADYYKSFPKGFDISAEYNLIGLNAITTDSSSTYSVQDMDGNLVDSAIFKVTDLTGSTTDIVTYETTADSIKITSKDVKGVFILNATINGFTIEKEIKVKGLL